jgi:hypothetical protein
MQRGTFSASANERTLKFVPLPAPASLKALTPAQAVRVRAQRGTTVKPIRSVQYFDEHAGWIRLLPWKDRLSLDHRLVKRDPGAFEPLPELDPLIRRHVIEELSALRGTRRGLGRRAAQRKYWSL